MVRILIAFVAVWADMDSTRNDLPEILDDDRIKVAIKDKLSCISRKAFASIDVSVSARAWSP